MNRSLGQIMVSENLLTNEQVDEAINLRMKTAAISVLPVLNWGF